MHNTDKKIDGNGEINIEGISDELVQLDVKDLAPPEPMTAILLALSTLAAHQILRVYHRREPFPLYEKLEASGWCHHCAKLEDDFYAIHIFKPENQITFDQTYNLTYK